MIQKEFSENNNSTISSDFQCLKALINRIWNSDFPKKKKKKKKKKSWNQRKSFYS